ncbi:MAG: hypothetical protein JW863_24120 [Chitinispirillaceae bacterium]|nr:hypothetical protein [Chitinispirillaceae bacterium]
MKRPAVFGIMLLIGIADVSFDALPEQSFYATLTRIAGATYPVTGTFEIKLTLDRSSRVFRPGLVADVKLYPAAQKKTAFVPAGTLVGGHGDSATVYAVDSESRFSPVPVIIGRLFGDLAAITTGLDGIDTVVVTGAPYLRLTAENITIARE